MNPEPVELARWQFERDRRATSSFPGLFERKIARMSVSPLSYLRGAAPLFYKLLADHPEFREGPDGEGWLCGDAHIENFGAYRTSAPDPARSNGNGKEDEPVVFDVNDFDEAVIGPWRFDVLRLATSLVLGGRELGADGRRSLELAEHLVRSYVEASCHDGAELIAPKPIAHLLRKVEDRSHRDLLSDRTEVRNGRRRFKHGERYAELPPAIAEKVPEAFERYVRDEPGAERRRERFEIVDLAFRIAGTGSLGALRIAVLTRGKGNGDGGWLFDMKEEGEPSASLALPTPAEAPARRVLAAVRTCLARPPRMIGTSTLDGTSLFVRRLSPQEDKLDLTRVDPSDLPAVASHLGALVGRAHRRAATQKPSAPWTDDAQSALIDRAISLAGIHEACYLAMCKLAIALPKLAR